ncbi:MAG: imelysin family protein [Salibacteraceae bacterium]|nr:imelysin family protein [Salibacteraceae bacterium]|tara:strand:- start:56782 stop:57909 length:1128 start_codon:yes stop_codon:yes gene_type:complete
MRLSLGFLIIVLGLLSCKKEDPNLPELPNTSSAFYLEDLLKSWSGSIIVPNYEKYNTDAADLKSAASAFQSDVSVSNLEILRAKWKVAYLSWQTVSMYEFGPAANITLRGQTNIYPLDTAELNGLVRAGSTNITGANRLDVKGFPAIDYLINSGSIESVLSTFTDASSGSNRLGYLLEVVSQIADNASGVSTKWSSAGSNYVSQFNSAIGTDVGSSLGLTINALNEHIERFLRDGKLGIPNGNRNFSGTALPNHVEAFYNGESSNELALQNVIAIQSLYLGQPVDGTDGIGLDDYLVSLNATYNSGSLNDAIKNQFLMCIETIEALPKPLKDNLVSNKAKVDDAVKALQKLVVLLKVDVPSATGILITYQDNDGD